MAIDKERKDELVNEYRDLLQRSSAIFLTRYGGMTVKEMEALRLKIGDANGQINVTKNTLLGIALEQTDHVPPSELLNGQLATSFALGEASALAKVLVDQAKANDKLKIVGGMLGNRVLTPKEVESLATLPSLDQLRAQILGLISAPAQGIVSAVANGVRQVVNVLDAYAKKDDSGAAPDAPATMDAAAA
ncbi:MAG TPA: 50S ribosomal protein L10 [Promineifilum sp.]|nr:50S ribosomal protein L10 [Promineifilum sp.]